MKLQKLLLIRKINLFKLILIIMTIQDIEFYFLKTKNYISKTKVQLLEHEKELIKKILLILIIN